MGETAAVLGIGLVFLVFTITYIVLFFVIIMKFSVGPRKKREQFKAEAIRSGRRVTAVRRDWDSVEDRDESGSVRDTSYRGYYIYTGIDGRERKLKYTYSAIPPEELTLYLDPENPRRFYNEGEIHQGKHPAAGTLLPLLGGFILYMFLLRFVIFGAFIH